MKVGLRPWQRNRTEIAPLIPLPVNGTRIGSVRALGQIIDRETRRRGPAHSLDSGFIVERELVGEKLSRPTKREHQVVTMRPQLDLDIAPFPSDEEEFHHLVVP
jgi:hypothetical protein